MVLSTLTDWAPDLETAIDRQPLIVTPETPVADVIWLISQQHHRICLLSDANTQADLATREARASCVLVMRDAALLGIFTERDVVRLSVRAMDFERISVGEVMTHPVLTLPWALLQDIFAVLFLFRRHQIRHLPVVDGNGNVLGVISQTGIRQVLRPANLLRLRRVADVMTTQIVQASRTTPILHLVQLMLEHRISCVVITEPTAEGVDLPVGIVTERDIVQFQAFQIDLRRTQAHTVMSTPLFLLSPEDSLWVAHQEMQRRYVSRLVVSWNWGKNLGIVTQTNLLRVFDPIEMCGVIDSLQQTIAQLENGSSLAQKNERKPLTINPEDLGRSLDQIQGTVLHLLTHPERTVQQGRSHYQQILSVLETLYNQLDHRS